MTQTPAPLESDVQPTPERKSSPGVWLLMLIFRLLLLGVGGVGATLVGIAIAQFYPARRQEPPLIHQVVEAAQSSLNQARTLLRDAPPAAVPTSTPSPTATGSSVVPLLTTTAQNTLMVTLPGDGLFESDQRTLRESAKPILSTIATDLQRYPGAAIRVAAHTNLQSLEAEGLEANGAEAAGRDRQLSFLQAQAVSTYLQSLLGDTYTWGAIGYGNTRPLADEDTEANRQRNRRIEITIDPR